MTALLELQGLTKAFGGLLAVDGLDLTLEAGAIRGLIGPNGSGKSTTLNLISGLYQETRGRITLDGEDLHGLSPSKRTSVGLARTFQNIRLFRRMTVLDNVLVARYCRTRAGLLAVTVRSSAARREEREARARALEVLEIVGLRHRAMELPGSLPYGQQRLVEIARALATDPRVLLLDEPAAGMNATEKVELLHLIRRLNTDLNLSVLLVEHDMDLVMRSCARITVLNFGSSIAEGTAAEVRNHPDVVEAYLGKGAEVQRA
jgi:branched-chain amino acid transport system ATP-binding protein